MKRALSKRPGKWRELHEKQRALEAGRGELVSLMAQKRQSGVLTLSHCRFAEEAVADFDRMFVASQYARNRIDSRMLAIASLLQDLGAEDRRRLQYLQGMHREPEIRTDWSLSIARSREAFCGDDTHVLRLRYEGESVDPFYIVPLWALQRPLMVGFLDVTPTTGRGHARYW